MTSDPRILNGKHLSEWLVDHEFRPRVERIKEEYGATPRLGTILVGDDSASKIYVSNKGRLASRSGLEHENLLLPSDSTLGEILDAVREWNANDEISGILVQLPLPGDLKNHQSLVVDSINPLKDVDGLTPINTSNLYRDLPGLRPCTPKGILRLLEHYHIDVEGLNAVIVGRSQLVGRPLALMLLHKNATTTIAHSRTKELAKLTTQADLLISAIGKANFITAPMVKDGAIVIDVGINRNREGKLVGDVAFDEVAEKAGFITPVPGGVGPMTVAMVVSNTIEAFLLQHREKA